MQGCYVSPWYTHKMLLHAVQVCFGPKLSLYSPFNLITHFFALRTFFLMSASASEKVTRDTCMVFCSPRTHPRDHQKTCYIVYVCHEEYWGSRGTNTDRVLSEYGQSTVRSVQVARFDAK